MRAALALGLVAVCACACVDPYLPNASLYVQQDAVQAVPLAFVSHTAVLTPDSAAALQALRGDLPAVASLSLAVAGGLAERRARQVGAELGRVVTPVPEQLSESPGLDPAVLSVVTRRLVATDCLAPGQPDVPGSWPADDAFRLRSMPPGCAAANAMQQMAVSQQDLQRGRPLPPGAALPVARAIERYYSRSEQAAPGNLASPGLGAGSLTPVSIPAPDAGADLLQGPLTQPTPATAASPAPPVP